MGELNRLMVVNPTMSLKSIVTESKVSGGTLLPVFRASATVLKFPNNFN